MKRRCPSCGSADIDRKARECRACHISLPDGSFDRYRPYTRAKTKESVSMRRGGSEREERIIEGIRP